MYKIFKLGVIALKLAYSTNGYQNMTLTNAVSEIGKTGYQGVEILADTPHAFPPSTNANWVKDLKYELDKYQLEVSNINGNTVAGFFFDPTGEPTFEPSICNADKQKRSKRIAYTKACIDMAVELEAKNISITSGMCLPGNPPNQALIQLVESLKEIMEYAEAKQINVGIEYEPGLLVENGRELLEVIDLVGSDRLGANLDLGHAEVIGENLPELLSNFKNRIWNLHMEDIAYQKHYHLIPGDGTMDFDSIFRVLNEIEYDGFVTVELYTYSHDPIYASKRSYEFLERYINISI